MKDNKKINVHYSSPNILGEKMDITLSISNDLGFVSDVTALFNRKGERPGTEKYYLTYDESQSTNSISFFKCSISFSTPGYRTFYIVLKLNGVEHEIKLDPEQNCAVIADGKDLYFWECFFHYPFNRLDWIKGAVMYQIFVDTFCSSELPEIFYTKIVPWNTFPKWRADSDGEFRNDQRYGGNIKGIIKKLSYIRSLVPEETTIVLYLTPILKSPSQNGYDISDYENIHEMFGDWNDVNMLKEEAHRLNMKIILDIVLNHSSNENPLLKEKPEMYSWKHKYTEPNCWWGYKSLVEFNKNSIIYIECIKKWLDLYDKYFDGIRLDVADNLSDSTLKIIRSVYKSECNLIIGEVWKNAITGDGREFLYGDELDSVMNYQFAIAIYRYIRWGNFRIFREIVEGIYKLYPKEALAASPIFCTSHDIPRMFNILVGDFMKEGTEYETPWDMEKNEYWFTNGKFDTSKFRKWEFEHDRIPDEKMELAYKLQGLTVFLQYTLPGLPAIFAGDEAGVMGYKDPMNRKPFPWDNINQICYNLYRKMGIFRNDYRNVFSDVDFKILEINESKLTYQRNNLIFILNRTENNVPIHEYSGNEVIFSLRTNNEKNTLTPYNAIVVKA